MVCLTDEPSAKALGYFQRMMPPRRGWGIFGLGFYKDGAPTALGKVWRLPWFSERSKTSLF
jgi:hypothetical protein